MLCKLGGNEIVERLRGLPRSSDDRLELRPVVREILGRCGRLVLRLLDLVGVIGFEGAELAVKHYRSDDMLYTFRSPIPIAGRDEGRDIAIATGCPVIVKPARSCIAAIQVNCSLAIP